MKNHAEKAPRPPQDREQEARGPQAPQAAVIAGLAPEASPDRPGRPRWPLSRGRSADLVAALAEGWRSGLETGIVVYDPAGPGVEVVDAPPYRYHHVPARATRPGARKPWPPPPEGLRLPHAPCPFDDPAFVRQREVARVEREGRTYHIVCNRYPVTPLHFLPVRSADAPPSVLPQHLHGPEEIEDMLLLLDMAGAPYRVYFNSNRGADGSQSGSSVNHWHAQLFPLPPGPASPVFEARPRVLRREGPVEVGAVDGWPARHVVVEAASERIQEVSRALWEEVRKVNDRNAAYNLEAALLPGGRVRAALFPRRHAPDREVPGAGVLSTNFGGWEMSGDIVIPTREILEWIRSHPDEARRLTTRRLEETTRGVPGAPLQSS
ncbi:MAG: hypothetical protein HY721_13790 [Planctomycetes bacterium]|nr:hypothetical protein [Planctomycetota bacterium]